MYMRIWLTLIIASLVIPAFAQAHGDGASWEQVFNQYKVDVGYDPASFIVGEPAHYDFNLTLEQGGQEVDFADLWVRVAHGNTTVFAGGIHKPSVGRAGMTFTFPRAGEYELSVWFEKAGESIVNAAFPVTVQDPAIESARKPLSPLAVAAWAGWPVAIMTATYAVFKKKGKLV